MGIKGDRGKDARVERKKERKTKRVGKEREKKYQRKEKNKERKRMKGRKGQRPSACLRTDVLQLADPTSISCGKVPSPPAGPKLS